MALTTLAVVLAAQQLWAQMALCLSALMFYLAVVRLNRCRVETQLHQPCRWRVRGLLGTCTYHVGYKRGLPVLVRGDNFLGLPTFMWPRDDFARSKPEQQPQRGQKTIDSAASTRSAYDWAMMVFAGLSLAVGIAALINDLLTS
ncbi:hypothetical protein BJF85_07160 [Saccharomonospora sp. CUA-673]|nr:hypothetical protein BJF85_07160 [Saccharomonospora sp. CUA-673]